MNSAASTLTLLFLLANMSRLCFTVTPQPLMVVALPEATTRSSDPEDNAAYRALENQRQQEVKEVRASKGSNASGRAVPVPGHRLVKSSIAVLHGDDHSPNAVAASPAGRAAEERAKGFLREYIRAHQVRIYIMCSLVLAGLILVFTLLTVYGDKRQSSWAEDESWERFSESYPLLDQRPLLVDGDSAAALEVRDSAVNEEDEQVAASLVDDEVDTTTPRQELHERRPHPVRGAQSEGSDGPWSISWSPPDGPVQVVVKTKQTFKRPIEVFPSRLLDLCNQCAPLTFFAFLPNRSQERCKWLAHGRHSEVFQVVSLVRRTVLKIMPIIGEFSEQQVGSIAATIEGCFKLNSLRHGTRYRTTNFIEVERIACVFDQFPEWLLRSDRGLGSRESLAESLASEMASAGSPDSLAGFRRWKGTNQCCLTRHFIVAEQRYAGKPLSRITLRSAMQGRSLFLQASCCVAVAERAVGFRHTVVDSDKLLVAMTDQASFEYRLPDRAPLSVDCAGLKAHLAGAMSFVFDADETEDDDFAFRENANGCPSSDCSGHGAPRFYGNVMWLGAVLDSVAHKLRSEVPEPRARTERAVFEELLSWQARLQECNSAAEFAATLAF